MSCVSPRLFLSTSTRLLDLMNENPDRFYKIVEGRLYDEARRAASAFLGAKAENLVFVPNATTGKTYMYIIQKRVQVYVFYFPFWESGRKCLRFIITIEKYMETLRKCLECLILDIFQILKQFEDSLCYICR